MILMIMLNACSTNDTAPQNAYRSRLQQLSKEELNTQYLALRKRVNFSREQLLSRYKNGNKTKTLDDTKLYLMGVLSDSLFQYWYGTPWDFNGITETPQDGKIACGYFVTTTLLHSGFVLDRVTLAQQAASVIINTLCEEKKIKVFTNGNRSGLKEYLKKCDNSIFILGLDSHVGFVQKKDTSIVMIHSSGFSPWKVVNEPFDDCAAIQYSQFFMIGDLLGSKKSLLKWLGKERFEMVN